MYSTKNSTTVTVGHSQATVLAASIVNDCKLVTWELVYPRFIHSELMTHRMFSRNASSSRATPVMRTLEEVHENPAFFDFVGVNKPGMVADEPLDSEKLERFHKEWVELGRYVAERVLGWYELFGIHKQTLNRALEPWMYIRTIVTATDTDNFFKLRLASDVQPEIRSLAMAMKESLEKAEFVEQPLHAPYAEYFEEEDLTRRIVRSVAACARVSVMRGDEKKTTYEEDLALVKRLYKSGHMSPFEHVAYATLDFEYHDNFWGWASLRRVLEEREGLMWTGLDPVAYLLKKEADHGASVD